MKLGDLVKNTATGFIGRIIKKQNKAVLVEDKKGARKLFDEYQLYVLKEDLTEDETIATSR